MMETKRTYDVHAYNFMHELTDWILWKDQGFEQQ